MYRPRPPEPVTKDLLLRRRPELMHQKNSKEGHEMNNIIYTTLKRHKRLAVIGDPLLRRPLPNPPRYFHLCLLFEENPPSQRVHSAGAAG